MATRTSPQGSAGSSPHHISGTIEAMVASTSQFPAGVYQNRFGYQNSSAAVGCSAPRSRIFAPGVPRDIHTRHIAKIVGVQTHYSRVGCLVRRPGPVDRDTKKG